MGASGKKLAGHGARKAVNTPRVAVSWGGHGQPPHPKRIRPGMRFYPRSGPEREKYMLKAAVSGKKGACGLLTGLEEQGLTTEG